MIATASPAGWRRESGSGLHAVQGLKVTRDGWLLFATAPGVQICDQPGRVNLIQPPPPGARFPSNLCFGGPDLKTLYLTAGDKVFIRLRGSVLEF